MDWLQSILTITIIILSASYIQTEIQNDIKVQFEKTDKLYENLTELSKAQSARTDKLYEMFIDLLKESKK